MKFVVAIALSFVAIASYAVDPPSYIIDLDMTPAHRHDSIAPVYKEDIKKAYSIMKPLLPNKTHTFLAAVFDTVYKVRHMEYCQEIEGIAKAIGMSAPDVFILNCMYELTALCTSIVAHDANNKVILARNLDFGVESVLRKVQIQIVYKKSGRELFRCGAIPGMVGALTCIKNGAFAVSLNLRKMNSTAETLKGFLEGKFLVTWMIKEAMMRANNYNEVVDILTKSHVVSGCYVTIAGILPNEGVILTRDRDGVANVRKLSENTWFVSQCNTDPWNATDTRSVRAAEGMKLIGQADVSLDKIANDLLFRPPLYWNHTLSTVLMSPVDDYMKIIQATEPSSE